MGIIKMGILAGGAAYAVNKISKSADKREELKAEREHQQQSQGYYPPHDNRGPSPSQGYDGRAQGQQHQSYENRGEGYYQQRPAGDIPPPQYRGEGHNQERGWERMAQEGNNSGWNASGVDEKR
jgi:hypothetical protein